MYSKTLYCKYWFSIFPQTYYESKLDLAKHITFLMQTLTLLFYLSVSSLFSLSLCHSSFIFIDVPPVCFPTTSSSSLYPFFHSHLQSFSPHPSPNPFVFCHFLPHPLGCVCVCLCDLLQLSAPHILQDFQLWSSHRGRCLIVSARFVMCWQSHNPLALSLL